MGTEVEQRCKVKPIGEWWTCEYGYWYVRGQHCYFWLEPRPSYCNRGDWCVHVESFGKGAPKGWKDKWPQFFFGLEVAKAEVEQWMKEFNEV